MIRQIFVAAALSASIAAAQDAGTAAPAGPVLPPPSAEVIKQYLDYQENGKDRGPVLLDVIPCTKVDSTKGSPTAYQCVEPVTSVPLNTSMLAWLQWMCPKDGDYADVEIQALHAGKVQTTVSAPVKGFGRTRAWKSVNRFAKLGKWTIQVIRGEQVLGSATVDVVPEVKK